tara:strand:+ start:1 stop:1350 length:1350 start_codon:yes stop_codon:yes gene_type:complete
MFKKIFSYPVLLAIVISVIGLILLGSLLRGHFEGRKNFHSLKEITIFLSEIPKTAKTMIKYKTFNINKPPPLKKHKDKQNFQQFIPNQREALLILPRYDHSLSRSVVEVIDLKNFKKIHTYKHNIDEMNQRLSNIKEFARLNIDDAPIRFEYRHPLILEDGSLISDSDYSIEFKIDFCSNLIWINEEEKFHHSKMLDHEKNIWVPGQLRPFSKYINEYQIENFHDDAIMKINSDGKILYKKSVFEILVENKILPQNYGFNHHSFKNGDLIHLNDIEPVLTDGDYWKKGDLFLSIRFKSAIIHYRPSTNKVLNYIIGPFAEQHDVDIISNKEISIFNNNNFIFNNEHSEILIYNFEKKNFKKIFNNQLKKENFKTETQGLSHFFKDGSLMVEEQNHGRIILFNNKGEKEWEFVNRSKNGNIGFISWSRVIEDKFFIEKFKSLVENKKCIN